MTTEIYIVSGFLGAGKTTLIRKMLKELYKNEKVVLIENDFGEISVDAALMKSGGVEVREMNSGCICCSLSGDFVKALKETAERFHPDVIIIEPSGVGKLSDIIKACMDKKLSGLFTVKGKITVADATNCLMYLENFGEFFEDQIKYADKIVLSRIEDSKKTENAIKLVQDINPTASVFSQPWESFELGELLFSDNKQAQKVPLKPIACACGHEHGAHEHEHGCCGHAHSAEEVFDTVTIHTPEKYTPDELSARINRLASGRFGTVLRAKGIVGGKTGQFELQYVPDDLIISATEAQGDVLCFIGKNLDSKGLTALFDGK